MIPVCDQDDTAQGQYVVVTPAGPLVFCLHHYMENKPAIQGWNLPVAELPPSQADSDQMDRDLAVRNARFAQWAWDKWVNDRTREIPALGDE